MARECNACSCVIGQFYTCTRVGCANAAPVAKPAMTWDEQLELEPIFVRPSMFYNQLVVLLHQHSRAVATVRPSGSAWWKITPVPDVVLSWRPEKPDWWVSLLMLSDDPTNAVQALYWRVAP